MDILHLLEAVLFVAGKPLTVAQLARATGSSAAHIKDVIPALRDRFTNANGIMLIEHQGELQLVSNPAAMAATESFVKEELSGPLTRPQLEALTIIAYCGPVSKYAVEQIRGVNCSLILRNLLMRGLIAEQKLEHADQPLYSVTIDFLRHIGLQDATALPDYQHMRTHEAVKKILEHEQHSSAE